jgi:hypothetical protein
MTPRRHFVASPVRWSIERNYLRGRTLWPGARRRSRGPGRAIGLCHRSVCWRWLGLGRLLRGLHGGQRHMQDRARFQGVGRLQVVGRADVLLCDTIRLGDAVQRLAAFDDHIDLAGGRCWGCGGRGHRRWTICARGKRAATQDQSRTENAELVHASPPPIVPLVVVLERGVAPSLRRVWPVMSGGHGGQLDEGIVAQRCHGFQGHVAGALDAGASEARPVHRDHRGDPDGG